MAAASGAHIAFSFVSSAANRKMRQRKSRRAITERNAAATKTVARGSIANARPNTQECRTGGESTTRMAASEESPARSPNAVWAIRKVIAAKLAAAKQLMI